MKLLFSLTSLLILAFSSFGNGEWLYYKHYPWVWDNMTKDWLYLRGSSDGKIYSYRASTQEWKEFSPAEENFDHNNPPSTLTVKYNFPVSFEMIWCPPGTFTMGSPRTEVGREPNKHDETEHIVTLTQGFYLGKYEVTQMQYETVMSGIAGWIGGERIKEEVGYVIINGERIEANPSYFGGNANRPVENITWDRAQLFLTRLNEQQSANIPAGWSYVLPTEAQWEYACRAGTTTQYSWGDDSNTSHANYRNDPKPWPYENPLGQTVDVGQYDPNPWGFFDMHGNVAEWTADWFADYPAGPQTDPKGPASDPNTGTNRVGDRTTRGGSWASYGSYVRSANRQPIYPYSYQEFIGFRVSLQKNQ